MKKTQNVGVLCTFLEVVQFVFMSRKLALCCIHFTFLFIIVGLCSTFESVHDVPYLKQGVYFILLKLCGACVLVVRISVLIIYFEWCA